MQGTEVGRVPSVERGVVSKERALVPTRGLAQVSLLWLGKRCSLRCGSLPHSLPFLGLVCNQCRLLFFRGILATRPRLAFRGASSVRVSGRREPGTLGPRPRGG